MQRSVLISIVVIALLIALGAIFLAVRSSPLTPSPSSSPSVSVTPAASASTTTQSEATPGTITLNYTTQGFSPSTVTVASGHKLTIKNNSSQTMQFDSNPHPAHTDNPELNVGPIPAGQSATVTLVKTGTWKAHNHLNPTDQVTVIVQ